MVPTVIGQTEQSKAIREGKESAPRYQDSQTIHIIDLSRVHVAGKRKQAHDALAQSKTVGELKSILDGMGIRDYAGSALRRAVAAQAIRVE